MNQRNQVEDRDGDGWFLNAAGTIGDLGHPFYAEERQRDVWNEASAVGLQVVLLLGLAGAAAMVWLGGAASLPYAVGVLGILSAGSSVTVIYARKLGVNAHDAAGVLRLRLVPYALLLVLLIIGVARAAPAEGFFSGLALGMVVGSVAALLAIILAGLRARHRQRRSSDNPA